MKTFVEFAQIKHDSKTPKYQQLVNSLLTDIESGVLKVGERLLLSMKLARNAIFQETP
jgi:DNA-binding GntR family transcriptional regulator